MAVSSAMLSTSLVERLLVCSTTCSLRVLFAVVRLVTAAQSSTVACARLANATKIPWRFLRRGCGAPLTGGFLAFLQVGLHFDEMLLEFSPGIF